MQFSQPSALPPPDNGSLPPIQYIEEKSLLFSMSGYGFLLIAFILVGLIGYFILIKGTQPVTLTNIVLLILAFLIFKGLSVIAPNEGIVTTFLGTYMGSMKKSGLRFINPFYSKQKISLRARNFNGQILKVNDKTGNPIEIAAVIVWQVADTAKAFFAVDNYDMFVAIQSEAAVRNLAGIYAYDHVEDATAEITLRDSTGKINEKLEEELNARLERAGVKVIEARISHLAYAPEIAMAMLQRQQAVAVVSARRQIVEGAVGMVEMALQRLQDHRIVELEDREKAQLVSNLLVVLCGEKSVTPTVSMGNATP